MPTIHPYYQPVELPFELPTRLYGAMLVIWLLRVDLQKRFPLYNNKPGDYLRFLGWCTAIGRREYQILRSIEPWNQELMAPLQLPALSGDLWQPVYTIGMYLAGLHRAKYWNGQILANAKQRHRAARWYFREGRQLIGLTELPQWQLGAIEKQFTGFDRFMDHIALAKDDSEQLNRLRQANQDIAMAWGEAAPLNAGQTPAPGSNRASKSLARWLPVPVNKALPLLKKGRKQPTVAQLTRLADALPQGENTQPKKPDSRYPFGVNLYGYARGELGIGEDVRTIAKALEAAGIPFCIINIELGKHINQHDRSAEHWISSAPRYNTNLFCMTGIEMARFACEQGLEALTNRYTIGLWPWELPHWPRAWHHAWSLVDELWGISHYAATAYREAPVPVVTMPLPVQLGDVSKLSREHWKLPGAAYLFVFAFDMNSTLTRKNPAGVIDAFLQAFPNHADNQVGLVLKISHLNRSAPKWRELAKHIKHDPRIHLVDEALRKPDVLALYQCCDCVISLHRSEGFGRILAEAQLLGKPLITTGYSGNMDFCADPPTFTVGYTETPLQEGDYFFGTGQTWAEPDLAEAANAMRECATNPAYRQTQHYTTTRFSPEYCGQAIRKRLTELVPGIANRESTSQRTPHD
ncbi:glycosyltransferase [Saccharospirillum sp.]|uniref:glycosyltransferase n=1 Tax=Saccharospirillum sp. TaxID=2033801 RepID=UPI0034A08645